MALFGYLNWAAAHLFVSRSIATVRGIEFTINYILLVAIVLALVNLMGPVFRKHIRRQPGIAASFGGGAAIAYVFLELLPEVEAGHKWLGDRVHVITLISFTFFFAVELRLHSYAKSNSDEEGGEDSSKLAHVFWLHIALSWIYTSLVIYAIPDEVADSIGFAFLGSLAIGLHLIYKDYVLRSNHHPDFESAGRFILALAPLVGWIAHVLTPLSDDVFDIFIATLAGFLMQSVFREEIPGHDRIRLSWFIGGAGIYSLLVFLTP